MLVDITTNFNREEIIKEILEEEERIDNIEREYKYDTDDDY